MNNKNTQPIKKEEPLCSLALLQEFSEGKEGFVEIQLKSVKAVDGQDVPLAASNVFQEGENKETLSIVLGVVVCLLFLTMKGKNAEVPAGYETTGTVAVATTVNVK